MLFNEECPISAKLLNLPLGFPTFFKEREIVGLFIFVLFFSFFYLPFLVFYRSYADFGVCLLRKEYLEF